jgi:glycosyltransferase involved in cell wall biosynthesis
MRFLMICMQFPTGEGESSPTTDLADALVEAGHRVEVLLLDWSGDHLGESATATRGGVRVVRCTPRPLRGFGLTVAGASKFLLSGRQVAKAARRHFDLDQFDAAIAWMPATAIAPLLPLLEAAGIEHRILFIWDFFPDHHHEIGRIPGGLPLAIARWRERRLVARFTAIVCTMPGNAAYLRANYPISADQQVLVTPVWAQTSPRAPVDRAAIRRLYGLPPDRPIAVFGGQMVDGRGFDQMLEAARIAQAEGSPLLFLFVGDGPRAAELGKRAGREENVVYRPRVARREYLDLVGACDVGMVATVPGVSSFSIPSKTVDYLRAGLPVVASVEAGSDYVEILRRYRVGTSVPFNDPERFAREAVRLATDPAARAEAREGARPCLDEVFDVRHAVATILEAAASKESCATGRPA